MTIFKPTRRNFIKTITGTTAAFAMPAIWTSARGQENRLTVGDTGGVATEAYAEAFYRPYFQQTGIQIIPVERRESPVAEIRAIVETGTYRYDFCEGIGHDVAATLEEGDFLEELDLSGETEDIPNNMKSSTFIGSNVGAFILAYRTDKFSRPLNFADIWNPEQFPGRRGLRQNARDTLQIALVADGVAPADISNVLANEEGWQRAFAKLDEIKPHIDVWWTSAAQTPTFLQTAELDICPTFNLRAQSVIDEGSPVGITWDGGFYMNYGWCIPKGSPKADMARDFIKFCSNAKAQAIASELRSSGPCNPKALEFIDPVRARDLPTHPDNIANMVLTDFRFWGPRQEEATNRFDEWLMA
ncbi:extracellular solute-binding protein [Aquamicrobium sp. LC103]|uniref:extracellular solute-binding protein n=1 Tax=Aquamicrobium sp. LC103 TaxID=1120658 RepID=UPI00063E8F23|nr:extracellular solute-binding protein [Aquamicrobium sp. LC103]TKT69428.1 extracellular solute-binding protein [Aquamicrobium sp. LC103]